LSEYHFLFGGFVTGLVMAAPVGPVAALCISVTLRRGAAHGILAGLGAALGDALFAAIAGFGCAGVGVLLHGHDSMLRLAGGLVVGFVAVRRLRETSTSTERMSGDDPPPRICASLLEPMLLALGNPATILTFAAALGALGLSGVDVSPKASALVTVGVLTGAWVWWIILAGVTSRFRGPSPPKATTLARLDQFVTVVLALFAGYLLLSGMLPLGAQLIASGL